MLIVFLSAFFILKTTFRLIKLHGLIGSLSSSSLSRKKRINMMSSFIAKPNDVESPNVVTFKPNDKQHCYETGGQNVTVIGSAGNYDHGSSKVKLKNIVDYKWETKKYPGHLIAVHNDGKHLAYVINVNNKISRSEGMIRVLNAANGLRALIKGLTGEVLDLQFAHIDTKRLLASIDASSLYVHKIELVGESLTCNLVIKVEDPLENYIPKYDKISWCPDAECSSEDDEYGSQLIVWARGHIFQCFNVNILASKYGKIGKFCPQQISLGYLKYSEPSMMITWVTLSPDGTTLGVGGEDGVIRFYQVYFHEKEPRCLHQWKPHDGKPVSSFFFLDNLKTASDSYWKYALTGADNNAEFKIWDCGTWECLQTVNFKSNDDKQLNFIAEIDRTSSYLVISNMDTRLMYVLQIITSNEGKPSLKVPSTTSEGLDRKVTTEVSDVQSNKTKIMGAGIKSISEFPLSSPILSFSIVDASVRRYKCANDSYLIDEMDDYEEETNSIYCVVVRMFLVQPKSVQECHILYQPTVDESTEVKDNIFSGTSTSEFIENAGDNSNTNNLDKVTGSLIAASDKGGLDVLFDCVANVQGNAGNDKTDSRNPSPGLSTTSSHKSFTQVNLMTPDAFSSSSEIENNTGRLKLENITSGNSSPSREVQEIMSLQEFDCRKSSFSGDETDQGKSENGPTGTAVNNLTENHKIKMDPDSKSPQSTDASWPKVPDVRKVTKHSTEIQNSQHILDLNVKMDQILDLVQKQSIQINALRKEIIEIKTSNTYGMCKEMKDFAYKIEMQLSKLLEQYLKRYENEYKKKFSAFLSGKDQQNREFRDTFVQLINQFILTRLTEVISKVLSIEVQRQIMPMLAAKIDGLQQQIQMEVNNKIKTMDMMLKDNIAHVCKSKNIIDTFGKSVLIGVQGSLQAAFIESMSSTLIPAYEKSSQNMFKQLHETFSVGIKEVMDQLDNYLSQLQPTQNSSDEIINKFGEFRQHLDTVLLKHKNSMQESVLDTKNDVKHLEMAMARQITEVIRTEVRKTMETQAVALRSQANSPVPSLYETKELIKYHLSAGQINKAFHKALLANNLALVEFTLQRADHNAVFNPCCLEPKVLLSLIQQISADMNNHNEVKQNYLSDAILSIDPNDPITREHAPKVMQELYRNCQEFIRAHQKHPQCSNVRMIMKAIQGLTTEKY